MDDHEIELIHLGQHDAQNSALDPIGEDTVLKALQIVLDPKNYPLHIMCHLGRHRTGTRARLDRRGPAAGRPAGARGSAAGTVVGCLRKLQRWNLTSIFEEYRRYAGSKVRLQNEQFIEFFDTDLVSMPQKRPPWV